MSSYRVPLHNRLSRAIFRPIFRLFFRLFSSVKIIGLENVPSHGPYLVAFNHVSLYDPPFLLAFWPETLEGAGASDLWIRPGVSLFANIYGAIQVHRGQYDRALFDSILQILEAGRPLVIAPEGGRSHKPGMRRGMPGISYIIDQANVWVVPVGIIGATDDFFQNVLKFKRPVIEMHIGKPLQLPPLEGKGEQRRIARQRNVDQVMFEVARLLPDEYRGVYASLVDLSTEAQE